MKINQMKTKQAVIDYTLLVLATIFILIPVIFLVSTSFKSISEIMSSPTSTLFPKQFSVEGFVNLFQKYTFFLYLKNSVLLTVFSTLIAVLFATLAGYGFSRFTFRSKNLWMSFILVSQMFPSVMLFVPYYKLLSIYKLSNSLIGLMLVFISMVIPFCTWMMYGYFEGVPKDLDDAAAIDGCSKFKKFFVIIAPLTLPGILTTVIYSFIQCWNEYMFTMIIATNNNMKTLTLSIGEMAGYYKILWNDLMAASFISSIPLLIMFVVLQKYFVSSLAQGAVKG
jgi:multiple sugar transport system permease protein/raffinose/stachyose/melibiose transport system permease protein